MALSISTFSPALGHVVLKDLEPNQIQKFYNTEIKKKSMRDKDKAISPTTVHKMIIIIKASLNQALIERKITYNPAYGIKSGQKKRKMPFMMPDQVKEFLIRINGDYWHPVFTLMGYTGIRLGEAVGLRWENVDIDNAMIYIREAVSWVYDDNGKRILETHDPKSDEGDREIPLTSEAVKALKTIKARQNKKELELKAIGAWKNKKGYVCVWEDGRLVDKCYLSKKFKKLSGKNIHSLRHTFASILIMRGVDLKTVQTLLGDSSQDMVMKVYVHCFPDSKRSAIAKIEGAF
jgi:integrase